MPGREIQVPEVLPEPAREIYRAAFEDARLQSCKVEKSASEHEACAASAAWEVVKKSYKKAPNDAGWIERTFAEQEIDVGKIPLPGSLYESPASAGLLWCRAFTISRQGNQDIAESASRAWDALKSRYANGADGVWKIRDDVTIEPEPAGSEEVEMTEPIVQRSEMSGASYQAEGTPILTDDIAYEDFDAVIAKYGNELAQYPEGWDWDNWISRPMLARTVEAVLRHRRECRAYELAVARSKKQGWTAHVNPNGSDERIFGGWNSVSSVQRTWTKAVLVTRINEGTDPEDWVLQIVSNTQSSTLMARVAPGMRRFRGPIIK